jgi:hypothetical protein
MKRIGIPILLLLALVPALPAQDSSSTGTAAQKPWTVPDTPDKAVKVPIGGTGYLSVGVKRAEGFKGDVTVELRELPRGVSADSARKTVAAGEGAASFTFTASADAPPVETEIKVVSSSGATVLDAPVPFAVEDFSLTPAGTVVMVVSVACVISLVSFCVLRVMTLPPVEVEETIKGPLEIDTRDTEDAD